MSKQLFLFTLLIFIPKLIISQSTPPPAPPIIGADGKMPNNYLPVSGSEGLYTYHVHGGKGLYSRTDRKFRTLNVYGFFSKIKTKLNGKKLFVATRDRRYGVIDEYGTLIVPHEFDDIVVLYQDKGYLGLNEGQEPVVFTFEGNQLNGCARADLFIPGAGNLSLASSHPNDAAFSIFDNEKCNWLHRQGNGNAIKNEEITLVRILKSNEDGYISTVFNGKGVAIWSDNNLSVNRFITDERWEVRGPGGKTGIVQPDGKVVVPAIYDNCYWAGEGFISASNEFTGFDLFTADGFKFAASSRMPYDLKGLNKYSIVYNEKGLAGVVNLRGEVVIPQRYSKIYRSGTCGFKGPKKIFAELYGQTEVYSDDFKLLTDHMYDELNHTREGVNGCSIIAGKAGMLEILDSGYRPVLDKQFVSFFHDSANLREMVGQNISETQFNANTQGWMIDELGGKFVLMKSGEIISVQEFINSVK